MTGKLRAGKVEPHVSSHVILQDALEPLTEIGIVGHMRQERL